MSDPHPSLRTSVIALIVALAANTLLYAVTSADDWFANVIAVASGLAAVGLVVTFWIPSLRPHLELVLLGAVAIWVANLVEIELQDGIRWETKLRQGGFYAALGVLALGGYLATRLHPPREHD